MSEEHHSTLYEDKEGNYYTSCACGWRSPAWVDETLSVSAFQHHVGSPAIVTNTNGGRQSELKARFDLIDPEAALVLAQVLHEGAEVYGEGQDNWRRIPVNDHLNHAVAHVYRHLGGDTSEDHLGHAFCRLMFAVAMRPEHG